MIDNIDKGVVKPISQEKSLQLNQEIESKKPSIVSEKSQKPKQRPKSAVNPGKKARKSQR